MFENNSTYFACPSMFRLTDAIDGSICRIKLPLGRITSRQLRGIADIANKFSQAPIELTTRANIQLRAIDKKYQSELVKHLISFGLGPLTKEGDDIRNVMVSATSGIDSSMQIDTGSIATRLLEILQTNPSYQKLSPKFSFLINGGENTAIYNHKSDIWLDACNDGSHFIFGFAGNPRHEINKTKIYQTVPQQHALSFITTCLDIFIEFQLQNPTITRMKHIVANGHLDQFLLRIHKNFKHKIQSQTLSLRPKLEEQKQIGIFKQSHPNLFYVGVRPVLGRLNANELYKIAEISEIRDHSSALRLTHQQGLICSDCSEEQAIEIQQQFAKIGLAINENQSSAQIFCCVGNLGCRSSHSNVQQDSLELIARLKNYKLPQIHLTGCKKSCVATTPFDYTLCATEDGGYQLYKAGDVTDNKLGQLINNKISIGEFSNDIIKEVLK